MSVFHDPVVAAVRAAFPGAIVSIPGGNAMVDANEAECTAMALAAERGGEFIDAIGQTDMARWSGEQWQQFVEAICGGYVESLMNQQSAIAGAVAKVRS